MNLESWKSVFRLKMQHTGCYDYLLDDKTKRKSKPSKSDCPSKYRKWKRDNKWICIALQTCLIGHYEGFALIKNERNGVVAWDILMNRYDRRVFNEGSSRAGDLQFLLDLTLESTKNGAFNKFISKFERAAEFVKIEDQPLPDAFKYDVLTRAIKDKAYETFITTAKTRSPAYKYHEFVYALQLHASEIEGKSRLPSEPRDPRSISYVTKINGYDCNDYGMLSNTVWRKMTAAQKDAYFKTKDKLKSEGKIKQSNRNFKSQDNTDSNSTFKKPFKSQKQRDTFKAKISKLKKQSNANQDINDSSVPTSTSNASSSSNYDLSQVSESNLAMINKLITQNGGRKINNVRTILYHNVQAISTENDDEFLVTVDGGADTCLDGKGHLFLEYTERVATVVGFDQKLTQKNLHIGTSVTVVSLPSGDDILLLKNESIDHTTQANSMLSVNQVRAFGIDIDDCPSIFTVAGRKGRQSMIVGTNDDESAVELPFQFTNNLICYAIREPTMQELETLPIFILTSDAPWNPSLQPNHPSNHQITCAKLEGRQIINHSAQQTVINRLSQSNKSLHCRYTNTMSPTTWHSIMNLVQSPSSSHLSSIQPKPVQIQSMPSSINAVNYAWDHDDDDDDLSQVIATCQLARKKPVSIDPKKLLRNMFIKNEMVATKTIEATTQLGKHIVRLPQRAHLKSRYPQLNCRRLNEKYSTDTWFSSVTALGGETCVQLYYGVQSKFTECFGMSTESEGPKTLVRFIKERGAMSCLKNDNSKM